MLRMILSGTLCLATTIVGVYQAHAGVSSSEFLLGTLTPKEISAVGNGERYAQINPNGDMTADIYVTAEADGLVGRIKSVKAWFALRNLDWEGPLFEAQQWGHKIKYLIGKRSKSLRTSLPVRVPADQLKQ